jgi:putative hydrolase of the HAD superfamily
VTIPSPGPRAYPQALVLDLFGTPVNTPTRVQRPPGSRDDSGGHRGTPAVIEQAYIDGWAERHDGRLPTLDSLSDHLWQRCGGSRPAPQDLCTILLRLATVRLSASPDVLAARRTLRGRGLRIVVLSDASADSPRHGRTQRSANPSMSRSSVGAREPSNRTSASRTVTGQLGVAPLETMYCGDGWGDELRGANAVGLTAVRVERRGGPSTIAFGDRL